MCRRMKGRNTGQDATGESLQGKTECIRETMTDFIQKEEEREVLAKFCLFCINFRSYTQVPYGTISSLLRGSNQRSVLHCARCCTNKSFPLKKRYLILMRHTLCNPKQFCRAYYFWFQTTDSGSMQISLISYLCLGCQGESGMPVLMHFC